MSEAVGSKSTILGLLADNETKDLTAERLRSAIISIMGVYATISTEAGTAAISVGTSPTLISFASNGVAADLTADQANGRILIGAGHDGDYEAHVSLTFDGAVSIAWDFHLFKNGVEIAGTGAAVDTNSNGDRENVAWNPQVALVSGDYIQVKAVASAAASTFTLIHGQLSLKRMG